MGQNKNVAAPAGNLCPSHFMTVAKGWRNLCNVTGAVGIKSQLQMGFQKTGVARLNI